VNKPAVKDSSWTRNIENPTLSAGFAGLSLLKLIKF
jgi:hypothetical protein